MTIEFNNGYVPNNEDRDRQVKNQARIQAAIDGLAEHFSGILIIAHETTPEGVTHKYTNISGDPLAARYNAKRWVEIEELLENHKILLNYVRLIQGENENPSSAI